MAFWIVGFVLVAFFMSLVFTPWYIGLAVLAALFAVIKFLEFSHKCADREESKTKHL